MAAMVAVSKKGGRMKPHKKLSTLALLVTALAQLVAAVAQLVAVTRGSP
jgi:hypothetical protein